MKLDFAKKSLGGFFTFLIMFLTSVSVFGQANNSISGFVFGTERQPLAKMPVELLDDLNRLISRTETNGSGRYVFGRLSRGRYNVKILTTGTTYQEEIKEVEISNISLTGGSETFQQNFYLQTKASSTSLSALKNSVIFAQEIPKEAEKLFQEATKNLDTEQSEIGLTQLKKALEIFPDYFLALERLAKEFIKISDYQNAFNTANKAVKVNENSYEGWYIIGYSSYKLKSSEEAVKAFTKATVILPNSINALAMLGINLRQTGKYVEAEQALLKAKKLATVSVADIHWHLALLYTNNLKKYQAAITELELFLQAKPNFDEKEKINDLIQNLKAKVKSK